MSQRLKASRLPTATAPKLRKAAAAIIGEVKPRRNGAAEQRHLSIANEPCALPNARGDDELDALAGLQIRSKSEYCGAAVRVKLQHLNGISEVKVEDLVGRKHVHLGERAGFEEVINGGSGRPAALRRGHFEFRGEGAPVVASFDRMRHELEQTFDLVGDHRSGHGSMLSPSGRSDGRHRRDSAPAQ